MQTTTTKCPECGHLFLGTQQSLGWKDGICFHCHHPLKRVQRIILEAPEGSYGWLQWKGTNVCMDFHCKKCGYMNHIDDDFVYFVKCTCGTVYAMDGHVRAVELTAEEVPHASSVHELQEDD